MQISFYRDVTLFSLMILSVAITLIFLHFVLEGEIELHQVACIAILGAAILLFSKTGKWYAHLSCRKNRLIERTIVGSVAIILLLAVSNVALATFEMMMRHT